MAFGDESSRQFGGLGIMLKSPRMTVRVRPDPDFVVRYGRYARRAAEFARHWSVYRLAKGTPKCHIDVTESFPEHVGLGSGTQLGLALARALDEFYAMPEANPQQLAASVDRGRRSAVGTHGFFHGGLIIESGKLKDESLAPMEARLELPEAWRFVLIRPDTGPGMSGEREKSVFRQIAPISAEISDRLRRIVATEIVPGAMSKDLNAFGEGVFQYGSLAGSCFAPWQSGSYASPLSAEIVEFLRTQGVTGIGQTSWGPTLFALVGDDSQGSEIIGKLKGQFVGRELEMGVAAVDNLGARVESNDI
jgi:beta-ribofuranosylaminobenzene 5'-phosphate synthase